MIYIVVDIFDNVALAKNESRTNHLEDVVTVSSSMDLTLCLVRCEKQISTFSFCQPAPFERIMKKLVLVSI